MPRRLTVGSWLSDQARHQFITRSSRVTAFFAYVLAWIRGKLGTRGRRADRVMIELRDRIHAQGTLPDLGDGWGSTVVLQPAAGSALGGDFVVSHCDGKTLEVALVDVCGKGMDAGTRALLLSGAFGGLLGSVPRESFLPACNAYLRRGRGAEEFVTAVHLTVDLVTGEYVLSSAGHPPPARFDANTGRWLVTKAQGIVLGVIPDLASVPEAPEEGILHRGDAILLYTDGLVEASGHDIDQGIDLLLGEAERLVLSGFKTGAQELVTTMKQAISGCDDCAMVLIWRS
jgi:serine phosphatase RsbU (regulator of sigma subunit)